MMSAGSPLGIPAERERALRPVLDRLRSARDVVLTTHVNADGDGVGSEVAVALWLEKAGIRATIINPTPFPASFDFLLPRPDLVAELGSPAAEEALARLDLALVLDTSEPNRIGDLAARLDPGSTIVIDHHPPGPSAVGTLALQDPSAAATGEIVFDLLTLAGDGWPPGAALGVYVAIVSDTGSFRFANTTPLTHSVAAEMLRLGVDPEAVFQRLFATFPARRMHLLREALARLDSDPDLGLSWIAVPSQVAARLGATHDDFEGLVDHARSVAGTRVAILFRELDGAVGTKVSFRSNGDADVNRIARHFGGGGHVKAAGAVVDEPLERAVSRVLARVRAEIGG